MESKILWAALAIIVGANLIIGVLIWAYKQVVNPKAKTVLAKILEYCDAWCDAIEMPAKRAQAIMAFQSIMGFGIAGKRIYLPTVIVGWLFDAEVRILRWLGMPDLHKQEVQTNENMP